MDIHRRALILGAAAATVVGITRPARAAAPSLDAFIKASAQLCECPPESLDHDMAQRILQLLMEQHEGAGLQALLQNPASEPALASRLRSIWFTGMADTPSGVVVVGFLHALTWRSADFLHVPGSCGGATGYWSLPPPQSGA